MFYEREEMDVDNSIASNYPCLEKLAGGEKKGGSASDPQPGSK